MHPPLTVYYRSGCGYCMRLQRVLDGENISYTAVDVWRHDDGAAFVRSVNGGKETVPTVVLGETVLTNPDPAHLVDLIRHGGTTG